MAGVWAVITCAAIAQNGSPSPVSISSTGSGSVVVQVAPGQNLQVQSGSDNAVNVATMSTILDIVANMSTLRAGLYNVTVESSNGQEALGSRTNGIDNALVAATQSRNALNQTINTLQETVTQLTGQLSTANAQIIELVQQLNSVANCDTVTGVCTPRIPVCNLTALSGRNVAGLIETSSGFVNGGAAVPVGGALSYEARAGYYLRTTDATTIQCTTHGWSSASAPTPVPCVANCMRCTRSNQCSMCNSGTVLNVATSPASLTRRVVLNTTLVQFDMRGLQINRQPISSPRTNRIEYMRAQRLLVDATPSPALWYLHPTYDRPLCNDPAWVQVDLGSEMRIGSVTVWHYYLDPRSYCGQRIAVSTTGAFVGEEIVVADNHLQYGHTESSQGFTVLTRGVVGRYIRHWAAGSTANPGVHFIEMAVNAAPLGAPTVTTCTSV